MWSSVRSDLKLIYSTAVNAVKPDSLIRNFINITDGKLLIKNSSENVEKEFSLKNRDIYIIGFGKAVLKMCEEFVQQLDKNNQNSGSYQLTINSGFLSVPIGSNCDNKLLGKYHIKYRTGALNNMPDINSQNNTLEIINVIKKAKSNSTQNPIIVTFISGGGSALLSLPKIGFKLEHKYSLISKLVRCGADINELNTVRQCLSAVKSGKLAKLALAEPNSVDIISFIISDIIKDPIDLIASGPTVIKSSQVKPSQEALSILDKYNIEIDDNIRGIIHSEDSYMDSNLNTDKLNNFVIGNNSIALKKARNTAEQLGYKVVYLGSDITGEASEVAVKWAQMAVDFKYSEDLNDLKGICWLAGGETTVNMKNCKVGIGGRAQEMCLAFYKYINHIESDDKYMLLSAGTDGQDGPTSVAGVIVENIDNCFGNKAKLLNQSHIDLISHNSHNFFLNHYNDWFIDTNGMTGTNVMDIYCMIKCFDRKTSNKV